MAAYCRNRYYAGLLYLVTGMGQLDCAVFNSQWHQGLALLFTRAGME